MARRRTNKRASFPWWAPVALLALALVVLVATVGAEWARGIARQLGYEAGQGAVEGQKAGVSDLARDAWDWVTPWRTDREGETETGWWGWLASGEET